MATIVLTSYMVRHPLGGVIASNLQLVWGLHRLGHEVYVFEPAGYPKSCFDPVRHHSGDDCTHGVRAVTKVLNETLAPGRLCYVDIEGRYHGLDRRAVLDVFERCDLFIDRGDHRAWIEESGDVPIRVLVDPDPGYRQIKLSHEVDRGLEPPEYDAYFTYGYHVASGRSPVPSVGIDWRHVFHPVDTTRLVPSPLDPDAPFTTVMNWTSHKPVKYGDRSYGMKDVEFRHYLDLPARTTATLEVAVEGKDIPRSELIEAGWRLRPAVQATATLESYLDYIRGSAGEFSVVKEVYRAFGVGWFSDRSAAYLAMGRPVVVQDNGLAGVLPTGEGLFSVSSVDEAATAIDKIRSDPGRHSRAAREIAVEHLDTDRVLGDFLRGLGLPSRGKPAERGLAHA